MSPFAQSMVIHDLGVPGVAVREAEAEPPLVVDPDTVGSPAVAAQRLQPVPGRHPEKVERCGSVQLSELAPGDPLDGDEPPHPEAVGEPLGIPAAETPDHAGECFAYRYAKIKPTVSKESHWTTVLKSTVAANQRKRAIYKFLSCHPYSVSRRRLTSTAKPSLALFDPSSRLAKKPPIH